MLSVALKSALRSEATFLRLARCIGDDSAKSLVKGEMYSDGTIVRLVLSDPKKRNAMSLEMIQALHKELVEVESMDKVRAVVIAADGPAFSAGHDLRQLRSSEGSAKHREIFEKCAKMMMHIQNMSLPVIAEVNGAVAAAGCQLAATCDIVIAGESAKFSVPGAKVGLFCSTPGVALVRAVPRKVALDMLLTGDPIDAQQALHAGLVSRVVDDEHLKFEALKVAEKIASLSKPIIAGGKRFFYTQVQLPVADAYRMAEPVMVEGLRLVDAQEGIRAFIEKRKPIWTHSDKKAQD